MPTSTDSFESPSRSSDRPRLVRGVEEFEGDGGRPEVVHRVATARVVLADRATLQADFPRLRARIVETTRPEADGPRGSAAEDRIGPIVDSWLLENAGYLSSAQADQSVVNTPIELTGETALAYRPPRYGRAVILFPRANATPLAEVGEGLIDPGGALDAKGAGVEPGVRPDHGYHNDGLQPLTGAIYEVIMEKVVRRIFRFAGVPYDTLRNYGVLDLGFDIRFPDRTEPAGMLVRQASRRPPLEAHTAGSAQEVLSLRIEMLLRRFGVSCCRPDYLILRTRDESSIVECCNRPYHPTAEQLEFIARCVGFRGEEIRIDAINAQFSSTPTLEPEFCLIHDMRGFRIEEAFTSPFCSLSSGNPLFLGTMVFPSDPRFIQPDPTVRIPLERWRDEMQVKDLCGRLVNAYRSGELTGTEIGRIIDEFVHGLTSHLMAGPA